jgi:hypothetical protein
MAENIHFAAVPDWKAAQAMLTFEPRQPTIPAGLEPARLRIFVRDHKMRELAVAERTLEAFYTGFVFTQSRKGVEEARRLALDVSYGRDRQEASIGGHAARAYELGPEPEPDDIDGRPPSVVTWHDGEMFFFLASGEMPVAELIPIAASIYAPRT